MQCILFGTDSGFRGNERRSKAISKLHTYKLFGSVLKVIENLIIANELDKKSARHREKVGIKVTNRQDFVV